MRDGQDELATLRTEYGTDALSQRDLGDDPMAGFASWFTDARTRPQVAEANAMTLATAATDGSPSARVVLLKAVDPACAAFTWYTSLGSRKAREALGTGRAALVWWWPGRPGRQVRATGRVEEVARAEAAAYFATRPPSAQVAASVSLQSRAVASRGALDARLAAAVDGVHGAGDDVALADRRGQDPAATDEPRASVVPLPANWGGLRLVADEIEFWQGRAGRAHDRVAFLRLDEHGTPLARAAVVAAGGADAVAEAGTRVVDPHGTAWLRVRLEP